MPQAKSYYFVYVFLLLMLPMTGEIFGKSIGGDYGAMGGVVTGLSFSIIGAFVWVKIARTEQVALLATFSATCATVQSWSLIAGSSLSSDMRLITTVGCFLLTWNLFNRIIKNCVVDFENDLPASSDPVSLSRTIPHEQPPESTSDGFAPSTDQEEQEIALPS